MGNKTLAIVIPAYKATFLEQTLESIAAQNNLNFTVYIGDDNSPYNLEKIVSNYSYRLNIAYTKFDKNLGSDNLVQQWERCIDLIVDEQWIWLFSDDDVMTSNCVDEFYNSLHNTKEQYDIYKFDTNIINTDGETILENPVFSNPESSFSFLNKKLKGEIRSFVVEYIFSKSIYKQTDGFVNFPLAWGADDATWVKFGNNKGIYTISNAKVYWRLSEQNISNTSNAHSNVKCFALLQFADWALHFFKDKNEQAQLKQNFINFIFGQFSFYNIKFSWNFIWRINKELKKVLGVNYYLSYTFFLKSVIKKRIINQ